MASNTADQMNDVKVGRIEDIDVRGSTTLMISHVRHAKQHGAKITWFVCIRQQ